MALRRDEETESECQHDEVERIFYFGQSLTARNRNIDSANVPSVDPRRLYYPFCIVFIPFPILSWVLPFIGQYGIGMSDGRVRDFSGHIHIGYNTISYGVPTKYCQLDPAKARGGIGGWDLAIGAATNEYIRRHGKPVATSSKRNPSYVAESLNIMKYGGREGWNRWKIFVMMTLHGRYTSTRGILRTWLPFLTLLVLCTGLIYIMWFILPFLDRRPTPSGSPPVKTISIKTHNV